MRINNNISALNTHSRLNAANNAKSGSLAKLSSGLRINRAGDDAAGLAISEKMRGQIGGLKQATRNAQDGISLIQTAEGALNETHSILNRMRELAVQSSNDTNTDDDRGEIQKEMNELATEISRISTDTQFNTKGLLNGELEGDGNHLTFHIGANRGQNLELNIGNMGASALGVSGNDGASFAVKGNATHNTNDGGIFKSAGSYQAMSFDEYSGQAIDMDNSSLNNLSDIKYVLVNTEGNAVATSDNGTVYTELAADSDDRGSITFTDKVVSGKITTDGSKTAGKVTGNATIEDTKLEGGTYKVVDITAHPNYSTSGYKIGLADESGDIVALGATDLLGGKAAVGGEDVKHWINPKDSTESLLAVNASADSPLAEGVATIKVEGKGIDVSTQTLADQAIKTIDDAIGKVSAERSKLGATQNRLDHTINNLSATAENLSEAESRIRDVDMAEEMMEFTKNNILSQAATSMLAQANQMPQSVLQLLQ